MIQITNMNYAVVIMILATGMYWSVTKKKLTLAASLTGAIIGWFIFYFSGYTALAMMVAFFIMGSAATSWKIKQKQQQGLAETNKGKRSACQVLANAGMPALLALLIWQFPQSKALFILMIAACFSSAAADTLSSELGNVYGKRFYNILGFKRDVRGLNGVISLEGTLAGISGSVIIAFIYISKFYSLSNLLVVVAAGTVGNLSDSLLGATLERKGILSNNWVNFLNTLVAALTAWVLSGL